MFIDDACKNTEKVAAEAACNTRKVAEGVVQGAAEGVKKVQEIAHQGEKQVGQVGEMVGKRAGDLGEMVACGASEGVKIAQGAAAQAQCQAAIIAADAAGAAAAAGGTIVESACSIANEAGRAIAEAEHKMQLSKYHPLFIEEYLADSFSVPDMIVLTDAEDRAQIPVCMGSLGWVDREKTLRVMYLYKQSIQETGLRFYPRAAPDGIYYRDPCDESRFVDLNSFFSVMERDRITELKEIARALGAKHCALELHETQHQVSVRREKVKVGGGKKRNAAKAEVEGSHESGEKNSIRILFDETYSENALPKRPTLHWFEHDKEILSLIEARCDPEYTNPIKKYAFEISSESTQSMTFGLAGKIDAALAAMDAHCTFLISSEVKKEANKKMVLNIEF